MQATQIPKNQITNPKWHDKFAVHTTPRYVYQTSFKNLTKFFLLFARFLLSESPSVSFGVTWLLFVLVNDLMLEVSGSVDLLIDLALCLLPSVCPQVPVSTCLVLVPWFP